MIAQNQQHEIIIQKEREQQKQQIINQKWKQARVNFYYNQTNNKLRQAAAKREHGSMLQVFVDQSQIKDLEQNQNSIEQNYREQLRRCSPIFQIIEIQYTYLRTIKIQYQQKIIVSGQHIHPYSISAFQFFKVIHFNKMLTQVILKGILVQQLQQFIKDINFLANNKQVEYEREEYTWMKNFCPSKNLKLSIGAYISFSLENQEEEYSQKEDLEYFRQLFDELSDITVSIYLGDIWGNTIDELYSSLKLIKRLRMIICQSIQFCFGSQTTALRSKLFGGLISFTQIVQISFVDFKFISDVNIGDNLAIEQSLNTLFANNSITHLTIKNCRAFPILLTMKTLQSIELTLSSFRKESNYMEDVVRSNLSLRSIECSAIKQEWSIDDGILNQLQTLIIRYCHRFTLSNNISSQTPSNIKYLRIQLSSVSKSDYFYAIFLKLVSLTKLSLRETDVSDQLICSIPSQTLKELIIENSNYITDQGIQAIDKKWPTLKTLVLKGCPSITEHIFDICRFEGLMSLNVDKEILGKEKYAQQLKIKGIKVKAQ